MTHSSYTLHGDGTATMHRQLTGTIEQIQTQRVDIAERNERLLREIVERRCPEEIVARPELIEKRLKA